MKKSKKHIGKNMRFFALVLGGMVVCILACMFVFGGSKKDLSETIIVEQTTENVLKSEHAVADVNAASTQAEQKDEKVQEHQTKRKEKRYFWSWSKSNIIESDMYFTGRIEDGAIVLEWQTPAEEATLVISEKYEKDTSEQRENLKGTDTYRFTDGVHGKLYIFKLEYTVGQHTNTYTIVRRFLNFKDLSDIPVFYIDTEDGIDPDFEKAKKPIKGSYGISIDKNEYKQAILNKNTPVKLRVRGNASAYGEKKSYKLVFAEKQDMLGLGEEYADKTWVLLGKDSLLKTYFGFELGKIVGMEWEPRMRFVNVMMNGDWKGLYILCESIKKHPKRVAIDEDGFLIESDAYYWKETRPVFKSQLLIDVVRFTFKYPKIDADSDERFIAITNRIANIDELLLQHLDNAGDLIDYETFAAWGIAHDLMGTTDGLGSNMFFYQESMGRETKLKMGPLWDFDSILQPNNNTDKAAFWAMSGTYLPILMEIQSFNDFYKKKAAEVLPSVEPAMKSALQKLRETPGLEDTLKLEQRILIKDKTLDEELDSFMKRLHDRVELLNKSIQGV